MRKLAPYAIALSLVASVPAASARTVEVAATQVTSADVALSPDGKTVVFTYGITSLRDTGGSLVALGAQQDRGETTGEPIPRTFYSGEIFEGVHPIWGD
ncbi:MAG TPA: hypothetical protein VGE98_08325, partial [Thermoanaerobaculia bacterium]